MEETAAAAGYHANSQQQLVNVQSCCQNKCEPRVYICRSLVFFSPTQSTLTTATESSLISLYKQRGRSYKLHAHTHMHPPHKDPQQ